MKKILVIISIGFYFVTAERCNCGAVSARIINGTVSPNHDHPWCAALIYQKPSSYEHFCGGSIITPRHILTAAHCLEGVEVDDIRIGVGHNKISKFKKRNLIPAKMSFIHKNYDEENVIYDIALLVTLKEIKYNTRISPVCLSSTMMIENMKVTIAGWGMTSTSGKPYSDDLNQVEVDVFDFEACTRALPDTQFHNQFCTYSNEGRVFRGDSGSPVIWENPENGEKVQVGLVSYGENEANQPSVYTDISAYLYWIEENVDETEPGFDICIGSDSDQSSDVDFSQASK